MTTSPQPSPSPAPASAPPGAQPRRAYRSADDRMLSGVAGGLAAHLGVPATYTRAFFLATAFVGGLGVLLYGGLWLFLPLGTEATESTPGLDAATRQGKRPGRLARVNDIGPVVAIAAVGLGLLFLGRVIWQGSFVFWPVVIALAGVVLIWWQADEAQRSRWFDSGGRLSVVRAIIGPGGWASYARLLIGLGLVGTAIVMFAFQSGGATIARDVIIAAAIGVGGIALMLGPWLARLARELSDEREARARQQERADLAAHLHDSVLQTLALIQKQAFDPRAVATLARAQERDLRQWLYGDFAAGPTSVATALRTAGAEVEDTHGIPVEIVIVGDCPNSERANAVVNAAREAMVNAAKHSGAAQIDVYAELEKDRSEVFIRDRGIGFDLSDIPTDRLGVRNSVIGRMERHGGTAEVRSTPGSGTEVRLSMEWEDPA